MTHSGNSFLHRCTFSSTTLTAPAHTVLVIWTDFWCKDQVIWPKRKTPRHIHSLKLQTPSNIPLIATNFKHIAAQFSLADLWEVLYLPGEFPIKICGFGSYILQLQSENSCSLNHFIQTVTLEQIVAANAIAVEPQEVGGCCYFK